MAATLGPGVPSMATKIAVDDLREPLMVGNHLQHDRSQAQSVIDCIGF